MPREDMKNIYVLANHYAFPALTLWYFTIERPRMQQRARNTFAADILAVMYLLRLRNKVQGGAFDAPWGHL